MKDSYTKNISNLYKNEEIIPINSNYLMNYITTNNSFHKSYENLKETRNLELSIINSKLSFLESINYTSFEKSEIFSQIKAITKKYQNFPFLNLAQIPYTLTTPKPFNFSLNIFQNPLRSEYNTKNKIFLNQKRKIPFYENKKKLSKFKAIITQINEKEDEEKEQEHEMNSYELNSEKNTNFKKVIFRLDKKLKNLKGFKIKKNPGRKKKNSGEIGTHNKFSKDNMMRKLKNKVMESARKLINYMVKSEAGENYKEFGEMRKIQGIFCQELNIKFNYWFYFQPLKKIFQFKMSSKYSKGDLDSNFRLISKLYSNHYINKFPKTIKLLESKFHEYYHNIFLGEKNWIEEFNIPREENKYQIEYFLIRGNPEENEEEKRYNEKMKKLSKKYELFFLKKNPRVYNIKNEEKISYTKEIIKNISMEDFEKYKYYFIFKSIQYLPEIENYFIQYLNKNKDKYNENNLDNEIIDKKNEVIFNTFEKNKDNESQSKTSEETKIKTNWELIKPFNELNTVKKDFFKIEKESDIKEENKKFNFFENKNLKTEKTKFIFVLKDKYYEEKNISKSKNLFVINKNDGEKSDSITKSNSCSNNEN